MRGESGVLTLDYSLPISLDTRYAKSFICLWLCLFDLQQFSFPYKSEIKIKYAI